MYKIIIKNHGFLFEKTDNLLINIDSGHISTFFAIFHHEWIVTD